MPARHCTPERICVPANRAPPSPPPCNAHRVQRASRRGQWPCMPATLFRPRDSLCRYMVKAATLASAGVARPVACASRAAPRAGRRGLRSRRTPNPPGGAAVQAMCARGGNCASDRVVGLCTNAHDAQNPRPAAFRFVSPSPIDRKSVV